MLLHILNLTLSGALVFISICRANHMTGKTAKRMRAAYAILAGIGLTCALAPYAWQFQVTFGQIASVSGLLYLILADRRHQTGREWRDTERMEVHP